MFNCLNLYEFLSFSRSFIFFDSFLFFFDFVPFSPMLWISKFGQDTYYDGSIVSVCLTSVETFWPAFYFVGSISVFFMFPLLILLVLYTVITRHLMNNPGITSHGNRSNVLKYRKQVMFMLGAVVLSFFLCLLPFRALTLWIIIVPSETILQLGIDGYYSLVYFCRIMLYINSALNPILYNLMSSKFREGFLRLLGCKSVVRHKLMLNTRKGTFHTTSTNLSSSHNCDKRKSGRIKDDSDTITGSVVIKVTGMDEIIVIGSDSDRHEKIYTKNDANDRAKKINGFSKRKRSTFDDIEELEENSSSRMTQENDMDVKQIVDNVKETSCVLMRNGKNGCSMRKHSVTHTDVTANTKLLVTKNGNESINSGDSNIDKYNNIVEYDMHGLRIHYAVDKSEVQTFLQNAIGTESFV